MEQEIVAKQITPHYRYAGFLRRFIAFAIDGFIIWAILASILIPIIMLGISFGNTNNSPPSSAIQFIQLIALIGAPVYSIYFLYKYAATPGKMAMKIKVVSSNTEKLTVGRLFMREVIGKFLSRFFGDLGFLWYLIDDKRQTWHDHIANTVVLDTREVSAEELESWQAKQKSYLPDMLIFTGISWILMTLGVLFIISALYPTLTQLIVTYLPKTTPQLIFTLSNSFGIVYVLLGLIITSLGIVLFEKRKIAPFLTSKQKKLGVIVYIASQIITFLLFVSVAVSAAVIALNNFPMSNTTPNHENTYLEDYH